MGATIIFATKRQVAAKKDATTTYCLMLLTTIASVIFGSNKMYRYKIELRQYIVATKQNCCVHTFFATEKVFVAMDYAFDLFSIINLFQIKTIIKNLELNQHEYELNPSLYMPSTCTLSELKIVHDKEDL